MCRSLLFSCSSIFILICGLVSCKKEKSDPPQITFFSPPVSAAYANGDTIHVTASVHDDEGISKLTCSLVNSSFTPVLPVKSFTAGLTDYQVDFLYVINNVEIPTGNYNLLIFAADGETDVREYRSVYISELPRNLVSVFISCNQGGGTNVYKADTGGSPVQFVSLAGDFTGAAVNTRHEQLYIAGGYSGDLNAINTTTAGISWKEPNCASGGTPCFWGLSSDKNKIYVSCHDEKIIGYNEAKVQQFFAATDQGSFPTLTLPLETKLLAIEKFIFGGALNLIIYNNPGGIPLKVSPVSIDVKAMIRKNSNEVYIIGNENGYTKIFICDLQNGVLTMRYQEPGMLTADAAAVDEYHLVLATDAGLIEYDYNSNSNVPLVSGMDVQCISYEDAGNEIYAARGNEVFIYGYQLHNLIQTGHFQLSDSVRSVDFLYNREKFD